MLNIPQEVVVCRLVAFDDAAASWAASVDAV
jgi:hypothetical protein